MGGQEDQRGDKDAIVLLAHSTNCRFRVQNVDTQKESLRTQSEETDCIRNDCVTKNRRRPIDRQQDRERDHPRKTRPAGNDRQRNS